MRVPRSRAEERRTRAHGELLRGSGIWPAWDSACALEPPFEPFDWRSITTWDLCLSGFEAPYQRRFIDRLARCFRPLITPSFDGYFRPGERDGDVHVVRIDQYADDAITYAKAEQLLLALGPAREPIAFELFAIGESTRPYAGMPRIEVRFVVSGQDRPLLESQLHTHYPRSAVVAHQQECEEEDFDWIDRVRSSEAKEDRLFVSPLFLSSPYCWPVRTYRTFDTDPLGVALGVLDELGPDAWALLRVLFRRAEHPWATNLWMACEDPYRRGHPSYSDMELKVLNEKLDTPLYAATVTLAANRPHVLAALTAWVHQYDAPENQFLVRDEATWRRQWVDSDPPREAQWRDALYFRETYMPGMLLSARELAGLVHLPNPELPCERLLRVRTQTRRAAKPLLEASLVIIGDNTHRGEVARVAIPPPMRPQHCYIAGASGTGKSTLLLNLIVQDIVAGHGVGVLDPHGDLVRDVLRRIPDDRANDVILFDPADTEYPFALNILEATDAAERERIADETVMALERYFPASWGPRLERILTFTIHTALHAIPEATLADVERMLTDETFRADVLAKTANPRLSLFWHEQFRHFPKNACDPVLNKLSVFLMRRVVRNIICQRHSTLDFDALLQEGKILLANLSTGLLNEKVAGMFGSFLVTKIVNAAFRRARLPEQERRPWFLYVDEFQAFMNLSVGFERILAEARKYGLVLAGLANQYVGQLSPEVRQAIFGNVGTFVVFRLGIDDAHVVAQEFGPFKRDDILGLDRGKAIVRVGSSATSFNVRTHPPPPVPAHDPTTQIVSRMRDRYARPRAAVELELGKCAERQDEVSGSAYVEDANLDPTEDDLVT